MKFTYIILFFSFISTVQAKLKFKSCTDYETTLLKSLNSSSIQKGEKLLSAINARLDLEIDKEFKSKVKRARAVVKCTLKKLPKSKYKCSSKDKRGIVAQTKPIVGKKVTLYSGFWYSNRSYKISTLFHEATHKCATTDANYNYQQGSRPSSEGIIGWQNIASTYDYWIMYGFCIPGDDC